MSIQPTGMPPAKAVERSTPGDTGAQPPARSTGANSVDSRAAVKQAAAEPSRAELDDALETINKSMQAKSQSLEFSIDQDSDRTIVKIVDQTTKEVIRQIPTPEALEISKALGTAQGLLIKQTA